MLSFNHYAYGAVIDWVYRTVAGLAPDIEPRVPVRDRRAEAFATIGWARATIESAFGAIRIEWRLVATTTWRSTSTCRSVPGGCCGRR